MSDRLRAALDAVMQYQWSGDKARMNALHELCQAADAAASEQAALIAAAVSAERERCAEIVDEMVRAVDGADAIAAIRAKT